jgi:hypothetical protein
MSFELRQNSGETMTAMFLSRCEGQVVTLLSLCEEHHLQCCVQVETMADNSVELPILEF